MIVCITDAVDAMTREFRAHIRKGFSVFEKRVSKLSSPLCVGISVCVLNCPVTSKAAENIQIKGNIENDVTKIPTR